MTVANVNVTKVLHKRGNTIQNNNYTGINGELTIDTQAKTLRIHDGVTAGGNIVTAGAMASYIPIDPTITSIQANVAAANAAISSITGIDTSLLANAATQQTQINLLNANVSAANALIPNLLAVSSNILPSANVTYSLGSEQFQWKDLWVSNNTIYIGNTPLTISNGNLLVNGNLVTGSTSTVYSNANVASYLPTYSGDIAANITRNNYTWVFGPNGNLTLPSGGHLLDSQGNSVLGTVIASSHKGFGAHYGTMYNNTDDENGPINKLVIYKSTATPSSAIDADTSSDDFQVTGLTGSDVVAMLVVVSDGTDWDVQTPVEDLKTFVEAVIDEVILDGGVEGDVRSIANMKAAFYSNFNNFSTIISNVKTELEFFSVNNQFNISPQFQTGKGATFSGIGYNMADNTLDLGSWGQDVGTHQVGDVFVIPGNTIQDANSNFLTTPANDVTVTITNAPDGYIGSYTVTGTLPRPAETWPSNSISDGGDDEYDGANAIHTDLDTEISYNDGNVVTSSSAFGGGDYVVTYQAGIFGIFSTNAGIDIIGTSGDSGGYGNDNSSSGFDGDGIAVTGSLYSAGATVDLTLTGNIVSDNSRINFVSNSSGDGYGSSTIQLIPSTENTVGPDQYLIIDPTSPNHIHIRAGGTQDNSQSQLFLGGENSHFRVDSGLNPNVYINANGQTWMFGDDGTFTAPGRAEFDNNVYGGPTANHLWLGGSNDETSPSISVPSHITGNVEYIWIQNQQGAGVRISTTGNNWDFDDNGSLTLPGGNVVIGSQYGSPAILANNEPFGVVTQGTTGTTFLQWNDNVANTSQISGVYLNSPAGNLGEIQITTGNIGSVNTWVFGTDGELALPRGGIIAEGTSPTGVGDTITLTPNGGSATQALLIYPTGGIPEGDHIHLTAGGGTTELYLGNDFHYVKLVNGGNVEIRTDDLSGNVGTWNFGANANLTLPESGYLRVGSGIVAGFASSPAPIISGFSSVSAENFTFLANGVNILSTVAGTYDDANVAMYLPTYTGNIAGNIVKNGYTWTFSNTGTTTFPTGVTLSNARGPNTVNFTAAIDKSFQIETQTSTTGRLWSFGTDGNLTLPQFANINFSNGVNILSTITAGSTYSNVNVEAYIGGNIGAFQIYANANAATQATSINTINNTLTSTNVAIGYGAGATSQGGTTVAVGAFSGATTQGVSAVAIGFNAGQTTQGTKSVAIGMTSGYSLQGNYAVAIGDSAGYTNQGAQAIAIGRFAGLTNQANNTIILNATGANLNATTANTLTVAPVRNDVANVAQVMFYNTTSKEVTYGNTISVAGNINANQYNFANGVNILSSITAVANLSTLTGNISWTAVGANPPTFTTASNGTKIVLWPSISSTMVDYAIGIEAGNTWFSIPQATNNFGYKWYAGNTTIATLSGNGTLTTGNITTTGSVSATNFVGNGVGLTNVTVSAAGNIVGTSSNVTLVAGNYSYTFDNTGNVTLPANVFVGVTNTFLPNTVASFSANVNYYSQVTLQNKSSGNDATADYIVTANNGSDTVNFLDLGIINSGYDNTTPSNSLGNIVFAADSYIYAQGNTSNANQSGGNLAIGTATTGKTIKFFAGGTTSSAIAMTVANTGVTVGGNLSVSGNIVSTGQNVSLVAGNFTAKFDNTGILTLPTMGGDEGGEINFGVPATNTTLNTRVVVDVYQDRLRIFDGSTKGAYIDLSQASSGVGTLLNNRVSGLVNAGTFVTMDLIKATVTTGGNRGLSLATTTGSFAYSIGGTYGMATPASGGSAGTGTLTTTATASMFNWGFISTGDTSTYILTDTTNSRAYRITLQIGASFNNNMISIERLI